MVAFCRGENLPAVQPIQQILAENKDPFAAADDP
jgi:hypothetical protein